VAPPFWSFKKKKKKCTTGPQDTESGPQAIIIGIEAIALIHACTDFSFIIIFIHD
jgi:hypothetical protein